MAFQQNGPCRFLKIVFLFVLLFFSFKSNAQKIWTDVSFRLKQDTATLTNMQGATPVSFQGGVLQTSPNIPLGFNFNFGLTTYSSFYISPYGFIKMGEPIISNNPMEDNSVITALFNGTIWDDIFYKLVGNSTDRKMVIEFDGVFQPSGEPTKFQIWIHEQKGTIQFVYQGLQRFDGYTNSSNYLIFCKQNIVDKTQIASILIPDKKDTAGIYYGVYAGSHTTIPDNARFTFQPDLVKPANPGKLAFSNLKPACFDLSVRDNSINETLIRVERSEDGKIFIPVNESYPDLPQQTNDLFYAYTRQKPSTNYIYRVFATNGYFSSDTITGVIQTPSPKISGLIKIPGDYSSITSLLADASDCSHFGGEVIIELQKNYTQDVETFPVIFNKGLQHPFLRKIVIRPALDADIKWYSEDNKGFFLIDSVRNVVFDGRPGGSVNSRNLTFSHPGTYEWGAIGYANGADSGTINYCNIFLNNAPLNNNNATIGVRIGYFRFPSGDMGKTVNNFTLSNSVLSGENGHQTTATLINIYAEDSTGTQNIKIENNSFSDFVGYGINIGNGANNVFISGNRFFQPNMIYSRTGSCIMLSNTENVKIESNNFGGAEQDWGKGKFKIKGSFNFITYLNNSLFKELIIRNNKFANIELIDEDLKLVYIKGGEAIVEGNEFGESAESIISTSSFSATIGLFLIGRTARVSNNFFTGFHSITPLTVAHINCDSAYIYNNEFGGSDNIFQNTCTNDIFILNSSAKYLRAENNVVRGFFSSSKNIYGINCSSDNAVITKNNVRRLRAARVVFGINLTSSAQQSSLISNNEVFALSSLGLQPNGDHPYGSVYGIAVRDAVSPWDTPVPNEGIQVSSNKIHSFVPLKSDDASSTFELFGIYGSVKLMKTWNNMIRLGVDIKGNEVDSLNTNIRGILIFPPLEILSTYIIEHNSIYIGGAGTRYEAEGIGVVTGSWGTSKVFINNNIIQIDRKIIPLHDIFTEHKYINYYSARNLEIASAHNIWYSSRDTTVQSMFKTFQQKCKCDVGSFVGNPMFKNAKGDSITMDLHLAEGSPANNSGTSSLLNIAEDIDGRNRNDLSPIDIGCYAAIPCNNNNASPVVITYPLQDTLILCPNEKAILLATVNQDEFSSLQWQKNFTDLENENDTSLISSGDGIYSLLAKNNCGTFASRSIHIIHSSQNKTASVTITSTDSSICKNEEVIFTAVSINEGDSPSYQWKLNGVNVGENKSTYLTNSLSDNDEVAVELTSSSDCVIEQVVNSNVIRTAVSEIAIPVVEIKSPVGNVICENWSVEFSSYAENLGSNPVYAWFLNGVAVGENSTKYLAHKIEMDDQLQLKVYTSTSCQNQYTAESEVITFKTQAVSFASALISGETSVPEGQSTLLTVVTENVTNDAMFGWAESEDQTDIWKPIPGANSSTLLYKPTKPKTKVFCFIALTEMCVSPGLLFSDTVTITTTTSSPRTSDAPARLFPNPVSNELTIDSLDLNQQWQTLEIFSINGSQKLISKSLINMTQIRIPVYMLNKGMYLAVFTNKNGDRKQIKFVKQ